MTKRLDLRGGARVRLEIKRTANNRLLLQTLVVLVQGRKDIVVEMDRRECNTEEQAWSAIAELAQDRLCDLGEIAAASGATLST